MEFGCCGAANEQTGLVNINENTSAVDDSDAISCGERHAGCLKSLEKMGKRRLMRRSTKRRSGRNNKAEQAARELFRARRLSAHTEGAGRGR